MERAIASKTDILDDAGYAYNFDRELYINRKAKKAFSVEFVQDHREDQLLEKINEHSGEPHWTFYFNREPSEAVKHELECVLG
jgi:hypothetical protein